jgi:hypothetical protein
MWLRVVIRQNRCNPNHEPFIPDQNIYIRPGQKIDMMGCLEVRKGKYYFPALVCGWGWEGDEFVVNVL